LWHSSVRLRGVAPNAFGIGADVTVYDVPRNLNVNYPSPFSAHLFVRLHVGRD